MRGPRSAFASAAVCLAAAALVSSWWPAPSRAEMAGSAEGTLRLDDQPTPLVHAYVVEISEIPEMQFGDGPARYLTVLLTDRPLPEGRPNEMLAAQLAFVGELRGIGLDVNPETGEVMSGHTLLPAQDLPQFFTVITMGDLPMVVLEDWARADGRLRGRLRTPEPIEVVNFDGAPGPAAFTFEATFDAPIAPAPQLVESLEGDAARSSGPVAGLRRFIDAVAARDLAGIKSAVADGDPMAARLVAEDLDMMHQMLFSTAPDTDGILADLSKVYVFDNGTSVVVLDHGENGTTTFPLKAQGDLWKMGQP